MPKRKSTREHLLNTGAMIVGESGLRALTVRGLSLRAGTNTGSFVYHFGNREAFLTELLERWYEPLFTGIRTHANIHLPAFEKLEAMRYAHFLKKDGVLIVNDQRMDPMTVVTGAMEYPEKILETLSERFKVVSVDAMAEAKKLGNARVFNTIIIGVAAKSMDFPKEQWLEVIEKTVPPKTIDINKEAFLTGYSI